VIAQAYTCHVCDFSGPAFPPGGGGSLYVVRRDGAKLCPDCADRGYRAEISNPDTVRMFGYLACGKLKAAQPCGIDRDPGTSFDGVHGRSLGRVVHVGAVHPWTRRGPFGTRNYVRVRMFDGSIWNGTGAPGMWCSLRRSKS
jgi:hypothetical protein